jgi:hypothetical protein
MTPRRVPVGEVPEHGGDRLREQQERGGGVDGRGRFGAREVVDLHRERSVVAGPDRYLYRHEVVEAVGEDDRGAREDRRVQKQQQKRRIDWRWSAPGRMPLEHEEQRDAKDDLGAGPTKAA